MLRLLRHMAAGLLVAAFLQGLAVAQQRYEIVGHVEDITGASLPGATVFAHDLGTGLQAARSTVDRTFTLDLRPGRYRITATRTGFEPSSATVELPRTEGQPVVLRLAPAILTQSVIVSGSREEELLEDSVTKVDMISRRQLLDSGYERVSDILAEEPGIITRSSALGDRSETQIQGIDSRQSLILLDGYPVVGARGIKRGILNMDRQSTNRLDRIEVVKGASSALYGSDAIAGVINMITREPRQRFDANLVASGGSLGSLDTRGDMGFLVDRWSGFIGVERHRRAPYDLTPATFDTSGPGFARYDYLAKISREVSENIKLSLLANAFDNRDHANFVGERGPSETITNDSAQNYGATLNAGLAPNTQLQARGYFGKYDEGSAIDFHNEPGPINATANLNERLYRMESSVSQIIGTRQLLQGGFEWTKNDYRGFNRLLGDNDGQQVSMTDVWIHDRLQPHSRLSLTIGGRLNSHSLYGTAFVPRAGLLFRAAPSLRLRASWGQGFRAPDLGQLYFRFQNVGHFYQVVGNPHLSPETSTTVQLGFDYRLNRLRFSGTYFRNDVKNLIQASLIGRPTTQKQLNDLVTLFEIDRAFNPGLHRLFFLYRNIANVYTTGAEGKVTLNLTRNLVVSSGYTYLDARDKETNRFLSQRHRHHGNLRVWWSTDRLGGFRTNFRGTHFSKWPVSGQGNLLFGDSYQLWDWYAAKPVSTGVELYAAVDNLFNSVDSNLLNERPTFLRADPGRTIRVGVRWNIGVE